MNYFSYALTDMLPTTLIEMIFKRSHYSIMTTDYFVRGSVEEGMRVLFAEREQASLENSRRVSS